MALERVADTQSLLLHDAAMSRRAWGVCYEALVGTLSKTAPGVDLGVSSKYPNESFEDRSGEGVHVNSSWTWVSQSSHAGFASYLEMEWG